MFTLQDMKFYPKYTGPIVAGDKFLRHGPVYAKGETVEIKNTYLIKHFVPFVGVRYKTLYQFTNGDRIWEDYFRCYILEKVNET